MSQFGVTPGLMNIGEEAKPAYTVLPDPISLFRNRSARLRSLAPEHPLESYLNFAADVTEAQHDIQAGLAEAELPSADQISQALAHGMPPLSGDILEPGNSAVATLTSLLAALREKDIPQETARAIKSLIEVSSELKVQRIGGALKDLPADDVAERVLVLAAMQVHFARLAAMLKADDLQPVADGICPVCGSAPMTSAVVGWPGAHNTRYCACSLCGSMWNVVRIKCVLCSSTEGIGYEAIEGQTDTVKAETCDKCHRYVKVLYQVKDHLLDPLADDIATLGLDMLLAGGDWKRGGQNPFLLGY